jgi:hypothetical protein
MKTKYLHANITLWSFTYCSFKLVEDVYNGVFFFFIDSFTFIKLCAFVINLFTCFFIIQFFFFMLGYIFWGLKDCYGVWRVPSSNNENGTSLFLF